ncbi:hypothetical protein AOY94_19395 [Escherichia coli]|nr:hypothetical protein AOY94_19395 [Escherichia coli]
MIVPDKQLSAVVSLFTQNDGICLLAGIIKIMLIQGDSLLLFAGNFSINGRNAYIKNQCNTLS